MGFYQVGSLVEIRLVGDAENVERPGLARAIPSNLAVSATKCFASLVRAGILRASRPCLGASLRWHSVKGLNIGDGVYVFALAQLAASYECGGRIHLIGFEFIVEARYFCGNSNWLSAPNTRHSTVAPHQFSNHLNLREKHCGGLV
jgi:hypothetical protein